MPGGVPTVPQVSAGILLYRRTNTGTEVFLVHPGGPYWARKDEGAWSIPKGLLDAGEDELACARREFREETGFDAPVTGSERPLGSFRLPSGKHLKAWAAEGDCDPAALRSNFFDMEWPPGSGRTARFPEVDRGGWFEEKAALSKITPGQRLVLERFYNEFERPK